MRLIDSRLKLDPFTYAGRRYIELKIQEHALIDTAILTPSMAIRLAARLQRWALGRGHK